jgi:hypothetical protein
MRISSYPKLLQTSSLRIHSPLNRGVSGGDEDADQHYIPAAQLRSPGREVLRSKYQGSTTATTPRYTSANARYLSIQ